MMKGFVTVMYVSLLAVVMCYPGSASAQFTGESGGGSVTTVQEFKDQCDLKTSEGGLSGLISAGAEGAKCIDKTFIMEGNIVARLDDDYYEFKDDTGSINVEIDDFGGVEVGPEDRVRLVGETDFEDADLILEVDRLELVK